MRFGYRLRNLADVGRAAAERRGLEERERWPRERLAAFQRERLAALVEHASARVPFYRAHYGGPIARHEVRLETLPPVTKAMMMDDLDRFFADPRLRHDGLERHLAAVGADDELYLGEYRVMASSGSSGRKGIYVYDRPAWRGVLASMMRATAIMGLTPRLPRRRLAQVAAPDAKHMTRRGASSLAVGLLRSLRLSATQPVGELAAALERYRPEGLLGYPSALAMLAGEQLQGRLRIAPQVVCTTSEVRTAEMTARIREAWGIEPFDGLGLTETGVTAIDCLQHRGLHVFEDLCIFEVVDEHDRPVPSGRPGARVLVTNLRNRTQPFIRFEVTDLVTITDEACPCGRTFRRITAFDGRSDDILEFPARSGEPVAVHPIHLRSPLAAMPAVVQYQIVQRPDGLDVALVLAPGATASGTAAEVGRQLGARLRDAGADGVAVRVRVVDRIEREPGAGKFKLVKAAPR